MCEVTLLICAQYRFDQPLIASCKPTYNSQSCRNASKLYKGVQLGIKH